MLAIVAIVLAAHAGTISFNFSDLTASRIDLGPGDGTAISTAALGTVSTLQNCYDYAGAKKPDLGGAITVDFTVTPEGNSVEAKIVESTLGSSPEAKSLEGCASTAFSLMKVPLRGQTLHTKITIAFAPVPAVAATASASPLPDVPAGTHNVKPPKSPDEPAGHLDPDLIRRVVARHSNEIRFCYERGLTRTPELAGRVVVKFVIGTDGAVRTATIDSSTLASPSVEKCIQTRFERMMFPAPSGGIVVTNYPLIFSEAAEDPTAAPMPVPTGTSKH